MSLTIGAGPLSGKAPDTVNYTLEGPPHKLYFHDFPRRIRAVFAGETVADTTRGRLLHETGLLPVLYVPLDDLRTDLLEPTEHTTHCPFKGDAAYWSVRVGDRVAENAVWYYPDPMPASAWLADHAALYWEKMDAWYDEDEEVEGHLRDPYHRVDARASHRHVRVSAHGRVLAETDRPMLLSETGLPNRYYIPAADVRAHLLEATDTHTICPYKGVASYRSARLGDAMLTDVAWTYPSPLSDAAKIADHFCFVGDDVRTEVDPPRS